MIMHWKMMAAGAVLVLGFGTPLLVSDLVQAAADQEASAAAWRQWEHDLMVSWLPKDATNMAFGLASVIEGPPNNLSGLYLCSNFDVVAQWELESALGVGSCAEAQAKLHRQVTDRRSYIDDLYVPSSAYGYSSAHDTGWLNGCAVEWDPLFSDPAARPPGPKFGHIQLKREDSTYGGGWIITDWRPC